MKRYTLMISITLLCIIAFAPKIFANVEVNKTDTDVGIEFKKNETTISSSEKTEPLQPANKPTIQSKGTLPITGELFQPLILIFLGWLIVIMLAAIYLTIKKSKNEENSL